MLSKTETYHYLPVDELTTIKVDYVTGARALVAAKNIEANELLYRFDSWISVSSPSYLSVQVDLNTHIYLKPDHLQFVNHSCEPNTFFNTETMQFNSLRDIAKHEELTFFYPSTEWFMAQPFSCACGSEHCLGSISGAMNLSEHAQKRYILNKHIRELIQNSGSISMAG